MVHPIYLIHTLEDPTASGPVKPVNVATMFWGSGLDTYFRPTGISIIVDFPGQGRRVLSPHPTGARSPNSLTIQFRVVAGSTVN